LKIGGKKSDDYIVRKIKKMISDKFLKKFVDSIYRKRNLMVHEYEIVDISQLDRNYAKAIAEAILVGIIDPPFKLKNMEELFLFLENVGTSKERLKLKKSIISKLVSSN